MTLNPIENRLNRTDKWYGYLFISPMFFGYLLFILAPIIGAFGMSFTNYSIIKKLEFVGLDNYRKTLFHDPVFTETAWNTVYFTLILVPVNIAVTLALAILLKEAVWGIGFFRTVIFTPVVTSFVVWAIVWKYIFQTNNGMLNNVLQLFGIEGVAWLYNMQLAIPVVVLVTLLKGMGMNMVIFIAALADVPKMYDEAAKIDGANRWQTFRNITLPLISPTIFLVIIITMIGSFKVFAQIYVMTGGGPGTSTYVFVYYIYEQAFKFYEFGYASAIAFILFTIILVLTILQWYGRKRWVHYEE